MKKIISLCAGVALLFTGVAPAVADEKPTVVVIDSGFDSNFLNPIKEVCILVVKSCNNGQQFDESIGSSDTPITIRSNWLGEWAHGTKMADIVRQINPNANLILIRNAIVLPSISVGLKSLSCHLSGLETMLRGITSQQYHSHVDQMLG